MICMFYEKLDPSKNVSAFGLARQTPSKKNKVKLYLLTDIDVLVMAEKGIGGE